MPVKMKGITPQQRKFLQKGLYLNFIRNNPFPLRLNEYMTTQEFKKLVEPFFMIPPEIISPKTHIRLEVIAEFLKKRYISESAEIPPQESDVYQQDFLEAQGLIQEKFYPLKNTTGSTSTKDLYIAATR
jgi:hypothetical protein